MPFIVTTKRPLPQPLEEALPAGTTLTGWGAALSIVSSRAVATLGEAREACDSDVIAEFGGRVTLSDRTVIEVAPIHWRDLRLAAGFEPERFVTGSQIIHAFNAREIAA